MTDAEELALVIKAITCKIRGCFEWNYRQAQKVRRNRELGLLTPESILESVIEFVCEDPTRVRQVKEKRPEYNHRTYSYKVIVPYPELFRVGLFVEMELFDPDPEVPVALIVNAHEQRR